MRSGRIKAGAAAVAGVLLLSSCASFKGIESSRQLQTPSNLPASASLPAQGGAWPTLDWVAPLGGAPLRALVEEALADNPGLQVMAARLASAQAAVDLSRANRLPTVGAGLSSTYQRYTETGLIPPPLAGEYKADTQLALNFSHELDFWGRHDAELRAALAQEDSSSAPAIAAAPALNLPDRIGVNLVMLYSWKYSERNRPSPARCARQCQPDVSMMALIA